MGLIYFSRTMYISFFLFLVAMTTVESVNREKIIQTPSPQDNFRLTDYLGVWYVQGIYGLCSWNGAKDFTDMVTEYRLNQNESSTLTMDITWRSLGCTQTVNDYIPQDVSGFFILKDTFGDVVTSESAILSTDYTSYVVKWGCTRRLADSFCHDPYLILKTRLRYPSFETMETIQDIIYSRFEVKLAETNLYTHDNPCPGYGSTDLNQLN